jgi:hypothetical protein
VPETDRVLHWCVGHILPSLFWLWLFDKKPCDCESAVDDILPEMNDIYCVFSGSVLMESSGSIGCVASGCGFIQSYNVARPAYSEFPTPSSNFTLYLYYYTIQLSC